MWYPLELHEASAMHAAVCGLGQSLGIEMWGASPVDRRFCSQCLIQSQAEHGA